MRSPVGFCFLPAVEIGKDRLQLAEADGLHGLRAAGAGSAIGHRFEALGHLLEPLGRLFAPCSPRLRRLLDGLRGLLRCFFGLLLLGALAACCRSERYRHRHDCHSMHGHHPRPVQEWNKRAFYSLPNVRLSTAAVFEFIGRGGGVRQARTCTPLHAPAPRDASVKRGFGVRTARACASYSEEWSRGGQPDDDRRVTSRAAG